MTGRIFVKKINDNGHYASTINEDKTFCSEDNPKGLFKMVVCPVTNGDGQEEIRYAKTEGGYIVSGEGYIITGDEDINQKVRRHFKKHRNLVQREVPDTELW